MCLQRDEVRSTDPIMTLLIYPRFSSSALLRLPPLTYVHTSVWMHNHTQIHAHTNPTHSLYHFIRPALSVEEPMLLTHERVIPPQYC